MTANIINRAFRVYEQVEEREHPKVKELGEVLEQFMTQVFLVL